MQKLRKIDKFYATLTPAQQKQFIEILRLMPKNVSQAVENEITTLIVRNNRGELCQP